MLLIWIHRIIELLCFYNFTYYLLRHEIISFPGLFCFLKVTSCPRIPPFPYSLSLSLSLTLLLGEWWIRKENKSVFTSSCLAILVSVNAKDIIIWIFLHVSSHVIDMTRTNLVQLQPDMRFSLAQVAWIPMLVIVLVHVHVQTRAMTQQEVYEIQNSKLGNEEREFLNYRIHV